MWSQLSRRNRHLFECQWLAEFLDLRGQFDVHNSWRYNTNEYLVKRNTEVGNKCSEQNNKETKKRKYLQGVGVKPIM